MMETEIKNVLAIEPDGELVNTLETERGPIFLRRRVPATHLETMTLSKGLGIFFRYDTERQMATIIKIANMEYGNAVIAHTAENEIVGYVLMHRADEWNRWSKLNEPGGPIHIYEFGSIEVSREWRGFKLSTALMRAAIDGDSWLDDKIITSVEFAWHWDNEEMGLNKFAYRSILKKVIETGGFHQMDTDEPNVMSDSANMFMVRIGPKTNTELQQKFFASLHENNRWGL
jgi:hypothetical protein